MSLSVNLYDSIDSVLYSIKKKEYMNIPQQLEINMLDYIMVVSEFELQSKTDVHFRHKTPGKSMKLSILPVMG